MAGSRMHLFSELGIFIGHRAVQKYKKEVINHVPPIHIGKVARSRKTTYGYVVPFKSRLRRPLQAGDPMRVADGCDRHRPPAGDRMGILKYLQRRWRILKDGYQRFLLQQRKATRGSGAKRTPLYAHGRELEFLRPVLEWRETQASWEDSPLDSEEEEEEEEEEYLEEHASQEEPLGESGSTARAAAPMGEEDDEPGPSCAYTPARRAARGSSRSAKLIEELLKVVEKLSQKMDESQDEDVAFTNLMMSIARKVPPERKHAMRMALLSIAQSFVDGTYPCYQPPLH